MLDDTLLWSYWNVWKPSVRTAWESELDGPLVDSETVSSAQAAFAKVMSKARAGATPQWWAVTDRVGHA
jgi:hypothetical protein